MDKPLTPRQVRALGNINRLVDTAIRMFQEQGYDAVTIDDICAECGLSKGVFYYRFSSKEALVCYAHMVRCDEYIRSHISYDEETPFIELLRRYLDTQFELALNLGPDLVGRGLQGMLNSPADTSESLPYSSQFVRQIAARGVREGVFRGDMSAEQAGALIHSFVFGSRVLWLINQPREDAFPINSSQCALFLSLLLTEEALGSKS